MGLCCPGWIRPVRPPNAHWLVWSRGRVATLRLSLPGLPRLDCLPGYAPPPPPPPPYRPFSSQSPRMSPSVNFGGPDLHTQTYPGSGLSCDCCYELWRSHRRSFLAVLCPYVKLLRLRQIEMEWCATLWVRWTVHTQRLVLSVVGLDQEASHPSACNVCSPGGCHHASSGCFTETVLTASNLDKAFIDPSVHCTDACLKELLSSFWPTNIVGSGMRSQHTFESFKGPCLASRRTSPAVGMVTTFKNGNLPD